MPKTIIFSLDYDGCADILFDERLNNPKLTNEQKSFALDERKIFDTYLNKKALKSQNPVELYVGSNRQYRKLDKKGEDINHNGSCFTNFAELCESKGWIFRTLLLADVQNNQPAGSAIKNEELVCSYIQNKIGIIKNQLKDIATNHPNPNDKVHFYFVDNENNEIIILKRYFENNAKDLPLNIHLHLVRDYDDGKLLEISHIQNKKTTIITKPSTATVVIHFPANKSNYPNMLTLFNKLSSPTNEIKPTVNLPKEDASQISSCCCVIL